MTSVVKRRCFFRVHPRGRVGAIYRTRFKKQIVAEFLPPAAGSRPGRVVILLDGMPSVPGKAGLASFLASKGYWTVHPRYRGTWESGGRFLQKSPERDVRDVVDGLFAGALRESAFGRKFRLSPREIFVIGGSFGGAAAVLSTLDGRVKKAMANCPVVDWSILPHSDRRETSNPSYVAYLKEAFGEAYRLRPRDWAKLSNGRFYSPLAQADRIDPSKVLLFHAQDDPYVPWRTVKGFADRTGARLVLLGKGGHLSTPRTVKRFWRRIETFFCAP